MEIRECFFILYWNK